VPLASKNISLPSSKKEKKININQLLKLHSDVKSLASLELIQSLQPYTQKVIELLKTEQEKNLFKKLLKFDGEMKVESTLASLYNVFRVHLSRVIFDPILGEDLADSFYGSGTHPLLADRHEWDGHDIVIMIRLFKNESSLVMKSRGGHVSVLAKSFSSAIAWLKREIGNDESLWQWGLIHTHTYPHSLGEILPFFFNNGPYPASGDKDTVKLSGYSLTKPYDLHGWSSHYRQCFDMGKLDEGRNIHAPGQSGDPSSPHYNDYIPIWQRGDTKPAYWKKEDVMANLERSIKLSPK